MTENQREKQRKSIGKYGKQLVEHIHLLKMMIIILKGIAQQF